MNAHYVSINGISGQQIRPRFGNFIWNPKYSRYVWEGKLATTAKELGALFTAAAKFLQGQRNFYLDLESVEVALPEMAVPDQPEPDDWQSHKATLLGTVAELQTTIRLISETSPRKTLKQLAKQPVSQN